MKVQLLYHTPDIERNIAKAAAVCYDSDTEDENKLERRIKRLYNSGHLATFRFGNIAFNISGFSRSCSMQMLRHAFLDVLQRSQRYCGEFHFEYVTPPTIQAHGLAAIKYEHLMHQINEVYSYLVHECKIPKEDARYVLPNSCHTELNIIGNVQAWLTFLYGNNGRLQKAAQWEIREVAKEIEKQLQALCPNIFTGEE